MNSFEKNCFNVKQKNSLFYIFCTLSGNKFEVWQKLSDSFTKFAIITDQEKTRWKTFFVENPQTIQISLRLIKKTRYFPKFLRKICQTLFCVSRWTFGRKRVFSKILWPLSLIWNFEQETFGIQRNTFSKVVKTVFRVSGKLVWITNIFDRNNFFKNFFGLWGQTNSVFSKKLSRLSKNRFSVSRQMF